MPPNELTPGQESTTSLDDMALTDPRPVLRSLRKRRGRVTVGDVVSDTGLTVDQAQATLRSLLENRRGNLEVGQSGTLVYRFEPGLIQRDAVPPAKRILEGAWALFSKAFKVWIVLMLVVYFVIFVALLIAALVAGQSRGGGRSRGRRGGGFGLGGRPGGFGGFPSFWFWYLFWTPNWRWGRPYYGHRWEKQYGREKDGKPKVPFLVKVFSFVFGPDRPKPTRLQKNRSVIRLIRARRGVLTAAELVQHTGLHFHEAEEEMARLMVETGGDVRVTENGTLAYTFPELMISAEGRVSEREPDPAWRRLEPAESVTGNNAKSNAIIAGMNGFNLVAAATAPWFIFPRLELGGLLAWVGLVWVPVIFSTLFFLIPLVRSLAVRRRNARRREGNLRRVLLGQVFSASLAGRKSRWISLTPTRGIMAEALPGTGGGNGLLIRELQNLTAEFDGEVNRTEDGDEEFRFPLIREQFLGAEQLRRSLILEAQEVGEIVYASDQTNEEAHKRDLAAFDRELEGDVELDRYLQAPERVGYLDDFELVAFDEELKRERPFRA